MKIATSQSARLRQLRIPTAEAPADSLRSVGAVEKDFGARRCQAVGQGNLAPLPQGKGRSLGLTARGINPVACALAAFALILPPAQAGELAPTNQPLPAAAVPLAVDGTPPVETNTVSLVVTTNIPPGVVTNAAPGEATPATSKDLAWVEAQLQQLKESTGLEESIRLSLERLYQDCRNSLTSAQANRTERDRFAALRAEIPERLAQLKAESEREPPAESPDQTKAALSEVERTLAQLEATLATGQSRLRKLEAQPRERTDRLIETARKLAEVRAQIQELNEPAKEDAKPASSPELKAAVEAARRLKLQALELKIAALTEEQLYYEASRTLLSTELESAAREVDQLTNRVQLWRQRVAERRQDSISQDLSRWSSESERTLRLAQNHPLVAALIQTNQMLVARRADPDGLVHKIDVVTEQLTATKERLQLLDDSYRRAQARLTMIESAGVRVDDAVGHLLRQEARRLPAYEISGTKMNEFQTEISSTLASLVRLQDERTDLHFVDTRAAELAASAAEDPSGTQPVGLQTAIAELLRSRRDYLDRLIDDHNRYLHRLLELEVTSRAINEECEAFGRYISERILWIRSAPRFTPASLDRHWTVFKSYWSTAGWAEAKAWVLIDIRQSGLLYAMALLVALGLWGGRRWFRRQQAAINQRLLQDRTTPLRHTLAGLALTGLQVGAWVWPTFFLGWRTALVSGGDHRLFVVGLGEALVLVSMAFLVGWTLRELCHPQGVTEVHFRWPAHNTRLLHRHLSWAVPLNLPLFFVASIVHRQGADSILGQGFFLGQVIVGLIFAHCIFRPIAGFRWKEQEFYPGASASWQARFFYVLSIGLQLLLLSAAYYGYYYSALEITAHLRLTTWTILGCVLLRALIFRWLEILQLEVQRKTQEQQTEQARSPKENQSLPPKRQWFSLSEVVEESHSLIRVGLWLLFLSLSFAIWSSLIPALSGLNDIPLPGLGAHPTTTASPGSASGPSLGGGMPGLAPAGSPPAPQGVTMVGPTGNGVEGASVADLVVALLIVLVGIVVMRYLPGLLQLLLLNRLDLRPGVGYAVATLVRYSVVMVALVMACAQLGITWSKVQWIAAAFSLGIAFGLQEIFANFISGLIILFERPIRIGDIVTIGDVSGNVTRINIRATTIMDWDRREYLVPNKEFITGKLLNWTLSDPITRILVEVGIAYGSDTDLAEKLLLEAARENAYVMSDPAPRAIFWGFGDNALQFRLYVHIPKRNFYFELLHGLTTTINRKFKEAGITIAFPQRDIHLHASHPLEVRVLPGDVREKSPPPTAT